MLAALEQWPESGVPERPGAWLMTTARNRGVDRLRRSKVHARKLAELGRDLEAGGGGETAISPPRSTTPSTMTFCG